MTTGDSPNPSTGNALVRASAVVLLAIVLTVVFWGGLWQGGGLVGGDLYTYFFPQKTYYAEQLSQGEFPLWNSLVGHGYPLVGESQTGAFYPPHLLLYGICDVNTAYNAVQLAHYVLAFVFTWMYARRLNVSVWSAGLVALIYTYGWFPPRICLEWAIIGGAWLPLALWCVEVYLASRRWRYLILLSVTLAMQMLPGHFNLAFITQLTVLAYVPARLWLAGQRLPSETLSNRVRHGLLLAAAMFFAFTLSAVQLAPTWELKELSQRTTVGEHFSPTYGHIPPWYLTQIFTPWVWYTGDSELNIDDQPGALSLTNVIEAHLYFGLTTVGLVLYGIWSRIYFDDRRWLMWAGLGLLALLYTPGWLVPITQHLPGFGSFTGPGRYGIITTLAVAMLAGAALDDLFDFLSARSLAGRLALTAVIFVAVTIDLWIVSRVQTYATVLPESVIGYVPDSPVRKVLSRCPEPVRLFCPGPNLVTSLGVAATPPYLGLGPAAYFEGKTAIPDPRILNESALGEQTAANGNRSDSNDSLKVALHRLERVGVTHVVSLSPLDEDRLPIALFWSGVDPFLNRAWQRMKEPMYLYEIRGPDGQNGHRGRTFWQGGEGEAKVTDYHANSVTLEASSDHGGQLVLTDLAYPGWEVSVDGRPAESLVADGAFRAVHVPPGEHRIVWTYRPQSVLWGAATSGLTLLILASIALYRRRHLSGR